MRLGIDIGGTFTDFACIERSGRLTLWKEPSSPEDPQRAIFAGIEGLAEELGETPESLLAGASLVVHGTTIATNAVIQRTGPRVALLCTEGFRDVLYFRDGYKEDRFNLRMRHPVEFVPRYLRVGVPERTLASGRVRTPLDVDAVRRAAAHFRAAKVSAVAIAFLWSTANPYHERLAGDVLAAELPEVHIYRSSEVLPELKEWQRTSATVLSAYVGPLVKDYLRELERGLRARSYGRDLLVMQSNGGCAAIDDILRRPVSILASGPAAAPAAALSHGEQLATRNLIVADMGGTSFDVCLISDGRPTVSRDVRVAEQPVGVQSVDVNSIGAGGGSIGWVDVGGALRVGPQSAGAVPGPACYGAGGEAATVTDANVALGYIDPTHFLNGRRVLQADRAERAIRVNVAERVGLSVTEAAAGIRRVVDSNMASAIRAVSTERGIDPRRFILVCGGGAGGLHAAGLAAELGIRTVLIPPEAGTLCAYGMAVTDIRCDYVVSLHQTTDALDLDQVGKARQLLSDAAGEAERRHGVRSAFSSDEWAVDARYLGQLYELTITIPTAVDVADLQGAIERAYHAEHERLYTFSRPDLPVEVLHWRLTRRTGDLGATTSVVESGGARSAARVAGERLAFIGGRWLPTPVYIGEELSPGARIVGPALVQSATTTVLVPERDVLAVDRLGNLVVTVAGTQEASRCSNHA